MGMTVKSLKEAIAEMPDDAMVVLQRDSEGNGYSPADGAAPAIYVPESTYSGEIYEEEWTAEECCLEDDEWENLKLKPRVLLLWPTN